MNYDIPYYLNYLPPQLLSRLEETSQPVSAVEGLKVAAGLRERFPNIESDEALRFVCDLYEATFPDLNKILQQRIIDREFIDAQTQLFKPRNLTVDYLSGAYQTIIGKPDSSGRIVVGKQPGAARNSVSQVEIPGFLEGDQVTLFGPPDTAKMSINAMNAVNRQPAEEPTIVTRLVEEAGQVPRWGADNEDSQTPIMSKFLQACENLTGCFDRTIRFEDPISGKLYELADEQLSLPIKRIPGFALPDGNHLLNGNPLPLHLFDFATHLFHNWSRPQALVFYVPKLENEEEAAYLKILITTAEHQLKQIHPDYQLGTVKLFIVFENPRAIFRIREIAAALVPHFLGGSLGWHDFLGSTARLFKHDPNYQIPVKADPNIVFKHIRESHKILFKSLQPMGAIRIGGMYGVLYEDGNPDSYQISMVGYIKDVITQLKRGLTGFWVAHPAFVRPGLALVEAFRRSQESSDDQLLVEVVEALVTDESESRLLIEFIRSPDIAGLDEADPLYERSVLAASIETSDVIANNDPEEVRYNIFQALQYLTDWLCGNGCVALPASMKNSQGNDVFVRIMDDLATTERSRWELWAEIHHGRVSKALFENILAEEVDFIRNDRRTETKRVEVRWNGDSEKWYPVAIKLLRQLVTSSQPVEFATELLMPFTFDLIRDSNDPWATAKQFCPETYDDGRLIK